MKPEFICIGPEKTATTWLFSMLHGHPQVWLPPYKELRFLTEGNLVPEHSFKNLLFNSHWHCRELRRVLLRNTVKMLLLRKTESFGPFESFAWVIRYMFMKHNFDWYASLFRAGTDQLCGDITPNYYHIPESRIAELHRHNPQTKVILFVRNPSSRAWSQATMNYCQHDGRPFESVAEHEWISMLDELFELWHPYVEVIAVWQQYFPNMHIAFFDQLKEAPDQFFRDIANFLEINPALGDKRAERVVGKGIGKVMPEAIRAHLKGQYEGEIRALAESGISPYPERWLQS